MTSGESNIYSLKWQIPFAEAETRHVRRGETIAYQGDRLQFVYLIREGKVRFSALTAEGNEKAMYFLHEGGIFGETAAFTGRRYNLSAKADTEVTISWISAKDFMNYLEADRSNLQDWISMQAEIMEFLTEQILDSTYQQREQVICKYLYRLGENYGVKIKEGILVDTKVTHQLFADLIGCSRVTVSKIFAKLMQKNVISRQKGMFVIRDVETLEQFINE